MISKFSQHKDTQSTPSKESQSTEQLWTEVTAEQQETMKGGYPWPGFPPIGGGGFSGRCNGRGTVETNTLSGNI